MINRLKYLIQLIKLIENINPISYYYGNASIQYTYSYYLMKLLVAVVPLFEGLMIKLLILNNIPVPSQD